MRGSGFVNGVFEWGRGLDREDRYQEKKKGGGGLDIWVGRCLYEKVGPGGRSEGGEMSHL